MVGKTSPSLGMSLGVFASSLLHVKERGVMSQRSGWRTARGCTGCGPAALEASKGVRQCPRTKTPRSQQTAQGGCQHLWGITRTHLKDEGERRGVEPFEPISGAAADKIAPHRRRRIVCSAWAIRGADGRRRA